MRSEVAQSSSISTRTAEARRSRASRLGKTRTLLVRRLISCWIARSMGLAVRMRRQCCSGRVKTARPSGTLCSSQSARRSAVPGGDQAVEFLLRGLQRGGVPDPPQLGADALADGGVGGVVNGVLREVELAALPDGTGQDGAAGGMVVADDEADAAHAAVDQ